jgi:hypothetical protein
MKKIEDYLHLYLGCECEFKTVETQKLFSRKLIGIDVDYLFQPAYDRNPVYEYIKPILRPLSDMTEEEAVKVSIAYWGTEKPRLHEYAGKQLVRNFNNDVYKHHWEYPEKLPEIIRILLSQGFDLFGLIESGLAIDSTTLTNTK